MIKARQQGIQVVRSSEVGSSVMTLSAEVDDKNTTLLSQIILIRRKVVFY